jgi:hypothetical protein
MDTQMNSLVLTRSGKAPMKYRSVINYESKLWRDDDDALV